MGRSPPLLPRCACQLTASMPWSTWEGHLLYCPGAHASSLHPCPGHQGNLNPPQKECNRPSTEPTLTSRTLSSPMTKNTVFLNSKLIFIRFTETLKIQLAVQKKKKKKKGFKKKKKKKKKKKS